MKPKRLVISIFVLNIFIVGAIAQKQPLPVDTVRILTFNICHGATMKGDFDLDLIAGVIKDVDPDLAALQEVDFMTRRAKSYDLATELGWRARMASLFGRAMHYDGGEYGEGILSRYSFIASRNIPLP